MDNHRKPLNFLQPYAPEQALIRPPLLESRHQQKDAGERTKDSCKVSSFIKVKDDDFVMARQEDIKFKIHEGGPKIHVEGIYFLFQYNANNLIFSLLLLTLFG